MLYELLTGISPFAAPTSTGSLARVLTAQPDESRLPPATPGSVRRLVRRCLERDPQKRWRHMVDARIVIEEAVAAPTDPAVLPSCPDVDLVDLPRGDRAGIMGQMSFRVTPEGQSQAYTWHRALSSLYLADGLV